MLRFLLPVLCALGSLGAQDAPAALLPRPAHLERLATPPFVLRAGVEIVVPAGSTSLREVASLLATELRARTGLRAVIVARARDNAGAIHLDTLHRATNPESYTLVVSDSGIRISGASVIAARWGAQTLLQLAGRTNGSTNRWTIGAVRISDAPRFGWRGSMLDVGRHMLTVRDIERHIDLLSRYKMNVLHWHLTDDQGWRLAIARYPRLTQVGAWRREADGTRYGGFYTQAQVKHLVEYARLRGVTIVPEIEMPGHSSAAIAAYPQLGCTGDSLVVPTSWGVFTDIYCAGKEDTFTFLFAVLDEVMALFPSPVIHIGGDEVPKDRWKACADCQAVMRREGLADEEALQSWFMRRIAQHVAQRGRRVIGWDEVLDGPYVEGGMVQAWRDSSFTRKAVLRGHDVVTSPNEFTYLNRSAAELTVAGVYAFEPMPPGLSEAQSRRVLGGEVPLWSEHIVSGANLELMALPRLLAFADIMWSAAPRDADNLQHRLASVHVPALRAAGYAVGPDDQALLTGRNAVGRQVGRPAIAYDSIRRQPVLRLSSIADGLVLRGTMDGTRPTATSPRLRDGAVLAASGVAPVVRLQAFWGNSPVREEQRIALVRHAGIGARATTSPAVDARYPGTGSQSLVDGILGSTDHTDGLWQGWWMPDVAITVELPAIMNISQLRVNFLQNVRSWIVLPGVVEFSWSVDGATWSSPAAVSHSVPATREGAIIYTFTAAVPQGARVRYVRVKARASGPLPDGHPGAGQPAWLFADEVRITARP